MNKTFKIAAAALLLLTAVGCDDDETNENKLVSSNEQKLTVAQPAPTGDWSQIRQNIIDIETAQINSTATTTFMFNQGVADPIKQCPSIGFPIPGTYQLTNPEKIIDRYDDVAIPQQETTGVYTGDTTGTYIICVDPNGKGRITYWEGFVQTESGQATWNTETHQIESSGSSTATVTTEQ